MSRSPFTSVASMQCVKAVQRAALSTPGVARHAEGGEATSHDTKPDASSSCTQTTAADA